jgi:integrase
MGLEPASQNSNRREGDQAEGVDRLIARCVLTTNDIRLPPFLRTKLWQPGNLMLFATPQVARVSSPAGDRRFREATDRRHERRAMTPEEVDELLRFTEGYTSPNHNLTGPDRAKLYRLAFGTGFRANELRSLTPASFDLASDPPTITLAAAYSKRRRQDVQLIRVDLAELLRPWLDTKQPDKRVFGKLPEATARMLRADLVAARSAWIEASADPAEQHRREESDFLCYRDRSGRVADFHSTRHTFISGIVAGNASVKVAQELARHSTSRLTIDKYAHTRLHDVTAALEALPAERRDDAPQEARAATGTDDASAYVQRQAQHAGRETLRIAATGDAEANGATKNAVDSKAMKPTTLDEVLRPDASESDKRRRRDSNPGWRICNPQGTCMALRQTYDSRQ